MRGKKKEINPKAGIGDRMKVSKNGLANIFSLSYFQQRCNRNDLLGFLKWGVALSFYCKPLKCVLQSELIFK